MYRRWAMPVCIFLSFCVPMVAMDQDVKNIKKMFDSHGNDSLSFNDIIAFVRRYRAPINGSKTPYFKLIGVSPTKIDDKGHVALDHAFNSDNGAQAAYILSAHHTMPTYVNRPMLFNQEKISYIHMALKRFEYSGYQSYCPGIVENLITAGALVSVEECLQSLRISSPACCTLLVPGCSLETLLVAQMQAPEALKEECKHNSSGNHLAAKFGILNSAIKVWHKRNALIDLSLSRVLHNHAGVHRIVKEYLHA